MQKVVYLRKARVLIDTWWNVNLNRCHLHVGIDGVLIDTWWNVNRMGWIIPENVKPVLIDTWWNVNQF